MGEISELEVARGRAAFFPDEGTSSVIETGGFFFNESLTKRPGVALGGRGFRTRPIVLETVARYGSGGLEDRVEMRLQKSKPCRDTVTVGRGGDFEMKLPTVETTSR